MPCQCRGLLPLLLKSTLSSPLLCSLYSLNHQFINSFINLFINSFFIYLISFKVNPLLSALLPFNQLVTCCFAQASPTWEEALEGGLAPIGGLGLGHLAEVEGAARASWARWSPNVVVGSLLMESWAGGQKKRGGHWPCQGVGSLDQGGTCKPSFAQDDSCAVDNVFVAKCGNKLLSKCGQWSVKVQISKIKVWPQVARTNLFSHKTTPAIGWSKSKFIVWTMSWSMNYWNPPNFPMRHIQTFFSHFLQHFRL